MGKTGKTYCDVHREIELFEEVERNPATGKDDYFVHPCPSCMLDAKYEKRQEIKSAIWNAFETGGL